MKIERALTKERILEIYLNVAEWAPDTAAVRWSVRRNSRSEPKKHTSLTGK